MRVSDNGALQYSESKISLADGSKANDFHITVNTVPLTEDEKSCWFPLFPCAVFARGFPILKRKYNRVRLKIPLKIITALGNAVQTIDYQDGLVIKGLPAIFVPVARKAENFVQWHFIHNTDGSRLPC